MISIASLQGAVNAHRDHSDVVQTKLAASCFRFKFADALKSVDWSARESGGATIKPQRAFVTTNDVLHI